MGRLLTAASFTLKGLTLKVRQRNSVSFDGLGRISLKVEIKTANNGSIEIKKDARLTEIASISVDGGKLTIGERVWINRNMILRCHGRIDIGNGTRFGPNVCLYDHNHKFDEKGVYDDYSVGYIEIGENCWIGTNVTILKNTKIGDGCVIGAGCVVSGEIPAHSVVTSNRDLVIRPIETR